jgi:CelD/BcsL family acetyltransferase involved in cellulose biosynthesis
VERLRPGLCLMGYAIEHAIGEGHAQFDMLRGEYAYKRQWARQTRETHELIGYRGNPRALAYRARFSFLPRFKGRIKQAVSGWRVPGVRQGAAAGEA